MSKFRLLSFLTVFFMLAQVPGRAQNYFNESFDGTSFPPTSWSTYIWYNAGNDGGGCNCNDWARATSYGGVEPLEPTHTGAGMAWFNSWDMYWYSESSLYSPAEDLTQYTCGTNYVDFWMIRSYDAYDGCYTYDYVDVYLYSATYGSYYYLTTLYGGACMYPSV